MIINEIVPGSNKSEKIGFFPSDMSNTMSALKSSHTSFSDILESRASSMPGKSNIKTEHSGYLTYREVAKRSNRVAFSNSSAGKGTGKITSQKDETCKQRKKAEAGDDRTSLFMCIVAGMLGLDKGELTELLNEAGIAADSFAGMANAEENIAKLSELLGLDSEQKDTLMNVLSLAAEMTESTAALHREPAAQEAAAQNQDLNAVLHSADTLSRTDMMQNDLNTGNSAEINAGNMGENSLSAIPESMNNIETFAGKLAIKLKEKLSELKGKLETDRSTVLEEAALLVKSYLKEPALNNPEELTVYLTDPVNAEQEEDLAVAVAENPRDAKPEEEHKVIREGSYEEGDAELYRAALLNEQPQLQDQQGIFAAIRPENADFTEVASAGSEAAAVFTNPAAEYDEIISQVIEKAKVVMTADKSEMVMELEPETLGKLSLKLVTENSMVTAKFLADSHQVKQVLEANMQILRDSLEKQGLSVQGFSVSVRQDSNRQADGRNHQGGNNVLRLTGAAYRTEEAAGVITYALGSEDARNPYYLNASTINLTA